jgi:hypothetical protein
MARLRTFPAWSVLFIVAGWAAAINLIPAFNFDVRGELVWPSVALTLGLLAGPAIAVVRNLSAGFRVEHLLMLGLVFWVLLDGMGAAYDLWRTSNAGVHRAYNSIALFAVGIWLGSAAASSLRPPRIVLERPGSDLRAGFLFAAACVCTAIGTMRVVLPCDFDIDCALQALSVKRGTAGEHHRYFFGRWGAFVHHLRFFTFVVPAITIGLIYLEKRWTWRVIACVLFSIFSILVLIGDGGRRAVGVSVGAALLVWLLLDRRVRLKHIVGAAVVVAALLYLLQAMVSYRSVGLLTGIEEDRPFHVKGKQGVLVIDRNLFYLSYLATVVPERRDFQLQQGLRFYLTLPVPRALYPNKPRDLGINLPREMGWNVPDNFSVTTTVVGNFYLMGGYAWVLLGGLLYGTLANLCSRLLYREPSVRNRVMFALGAMTLFVALRSLHELIVTGYVVLAFLALLLLKRFWVGWIRRSQGRPIDPPLLPPRAG